MAIALTRDDPANLDAPDPLACHRDDFDLPDGIIYLDGNSLGAMPRAVRSRLAQVLDREWGQGLIRSWSGPTGWMSLPATVGDGIAGLIGAEAGEVIATDSTSVNLFKLLAAALQLNPGRRAILTEAANFPTDLYIAQGVAAWMGDGARVKTVARQDLAGAIDRDTAVVTLTQVDYRTAELFDMAAINRAARSQGALTLWDLSHSAGAEPVDLNGTGADLAIGCGYKFLNGGPSAPAYLYVARRHQAQFSQPLQGWLGHEAPFIFEADYRPAPGIARGLCGTPPLLAMATLEEGVATVTAAGMAALRAKSTALTSCLIELAARQCRGLALASPRDPARRGAQVSFRHANAARIMDALIARGVIGDFRKPDILRFGLAPLYTRFVDLWDAVAVLADVVARAGQGNSVKPDGTT